MEERSKPRLLLADDSVTIRKVVELTFADEGIAVTSVADAASAMQSFVETQPDVVLVDVALPDTSGYQICEMIKQDEATKHIPVLLLVGSFEPFDQDEAERVGADGFLTKPFHSIRDLVGRVRDLIQPQPETQMSAVSAATTSSPDLMDIEQLYENSFSGKDASVDEVEREVDDLGETGMDDEMIETMRIDPAEVNGLDDYGEADAASATKEFDWSPSGIVAAEPDDEFEATFGSEADERIVSNDVDDVGEIDEGDVDLHATISMHNYADVDTEENIDLSELGEVSASEIDAADLDEAFETISISDRQDIHTEQAETGDDATIPEPEAALDTEERSDESEPSAEFIARVAKLVVERLSDGVIREVAQEAVPRVAEKLIREAMEAEKQG